MVLCCNEVVQNCITSKSRFGNQIKSQVSQNVKKQIKQKINIEISYKTLYYCLLRNCINGWACQTNTVFDMNAFDVTINTSQSSIFIPLLLSRFLSFNFYY